MNYTTLSNKEREIYIYVQAYNRSSRQLCTVKPGSAWLEGKDRMATEERTTAVLEPTYYMYNELQSHGQPMPHF